MASPKPWFRSITAFELRSWTIHMMNRYSNSNTDEIKSSASAQRVLLTKSHLFHIKTMLAKIANIFHPAFHFLCQHIQFYFDRPIICPMSCLHFTYTVYVCPRLSQHSGAPGAQCTLAPTRGAFSIGPPQPSAFQFSFFRFHDCQCGKPLSGT